MTGCALLRAIRVAPLRVLAVVLLVSTTGAGGATTAAGLDGPAPSTSVTSPPVAQQTPTNNTTVERHQNPANGTERGNLSRVTALLADSLGDRLGGSSIRLSREQYDVARRYVGREYREDLARYFEVAGQTATTSDDRLAERFNETSARQRRLADRLERFDETRRAYRRARQAGNETRAERLARELRRLATEIDETRGSVLEGYRAISSRTSVDLSNGSAVLNETVSRRLAEAREIRTAEFTATELEVETDTAVASFLTPVRLRGRLSSNGTPLADRTVRLAVGDRRLRTETDANGTFDVAYRPVTRPLGTQTIRVRYVPGNESNLQTSNDTVRVTVAQVRPDVAVAVSPAEARYDDRLRVASEVTAGGVAVPSAPVAVYLDGELVATGETTREGEINESVPLSTRTPEGTRTVRVVVGAENRSVGRGDDTATLTVLPSPARLSIEAALLNRSETAGRARTVLVRGRLATADGTPVADGTIELRVEGAVVGTVRTDGDGRYETTVAIPASRLPKTVGGEELLAVRATYAGEETNLEAATERTSVLVQAELLSVVGRRFSLSQSVAAFLVVGTALALRRRYGRSDEQVAPAAAEGDGTAAGTGDDGGAGEPGEPARPSLARARRVFDDGRPDAAVRYAYATVRTTLAGARDLPTVGTHWEFYRAWGDAARTHREELQRLTALYERAAFDDRSTGRETAAEALSLAETLVDGRVEPAPDSAVSAHPDGGRSDVPDSPGD
jgi:hypothetical protein